MRMIPTKTLIIVPLSAFIIMHRMRGFPDGPHYRLEHMAIDRWAATLLVPLICWIFLNGLDDLIVEIAWLFLVREKTQMPGIPPAVERRMAIFVPLWKEHRVIE